MTKIYVLDTSVLISNPYSFKDFQDSTVIIPIAVFNELDGLKKQPNERGRNARVCIKILDEISLLGNINSGIKIENNILLKIDVRYYTEKSCTKLGDPKYGDTQILACLLNYYKANKEVVLVSNDINLRIKARARGVEAVAHEAENKFFHELYTGVKVIEDPIASDELEKCLEIDNLVYGFDLLPNECVIFENKNIPGKKPVVLGRRVSDSNKIKLITKTYPWNLKPRNEEQTLAIDLLMDDSNDLVTISGNAGTGKSLITLAVGLEKVVNNRDFNKLIIYRPTKPVSDDVGYLPGTLDEKIFYYFSSTYDTFEFLLQNKSINSSSYKVAIEMFQKKGILEMSPLTFIRGRSINNALIIVEESQNVSVGDIRTLLTRVSEKSRILLLGDISQIDAHELDANNNALTYVIEKFKNCPFAAHITLTKGERSRLATLASEIL
jgi:PhoH-like ATPase